MTIADPFDIFDPAFQRDPYPAYAWLREHAPIHWGMPTDVGQDGVWHVARHADIMQVLRDPRFAHRERPTTDDMPPEMALFSFLAGQSVLFVNPPAHTRLRGLVSKAFTPRAVEALRPLVVATTEALLDRAAEQGEMDVIRDYAQSLTVTIIASMLGMLDAARAKATEWARILVAAIDCKQSTEPMRVAGAIAPDLYQFFMETIEQHRQHPSDSILDGLMQAHDADDRLSETEIVVTATTLLLAGHETTVNLIGSGIYSLLRFPDELARLRAQPALAPSAVEEFLRYESSSQMTSREATVDLPLGDTIIPAGQSPSGLWHGYALLPGCAARPPGRADRHHPPGAAFPRSAFVG